MLLPPSLLFLLQMPMMVYQMRTRVNVALECESLDVLLLLDLFGLEAILEAVAVVDVLVL